MCVFAVPTPLVPHLYIHEYIYICIRPTGSWNRPLPGRGVHKHRQRYNILLKERRMLVGSRGALPLHHPRARHPNIYIYIYLLPEEVLTFFCPSSVHAAIFLSQTFCTYSPRVFSNTAGPQIVLRRLLREACSISGVARQVLLRRVRQPCQILKSNPGGDFPTLTLPGATPPPPAEVRCFNFCLPRDKRTKNYPNNLEPKETK